MNLLENLLENLRIKIVLIFHQKDAWGILIKERGQVFLAAAFNVRTHVEYFITILNSDGSQGDVLIL